MRLEKEYGFLVGIGNSLANIWIKIDFRGGHFNIM